MAKIINLPTNKDERGDLTVIEKLLPFEIKRVFFIHHIPDDIYRGRHGHKKNEIGMVCVNGSCEVLIRSKNEECVFLLDNPSKLLYLRPQDWHEMNRFKGNCILLVLASEYYDPDDYIYEID